MIENSNGNYVVQHSRHLGVASNNSAEIDALLDSTDKVRNTKEISPETPVFFFVDSSETIRLATGRAVARKWCVDRVHRIKENLKQIGQQRRTAVCWVPGHADIPGNEAADAVAKRGAAGFTGYGKIQSDHPTRPESTPRNTYGTESKQEPYANMLARVKDWSKLRKLRKLSRKRKKLQLAMDKSLQSSPKEEPRHNYNTRRSKRVRVKLDTERNANCPT